MKKAIGGFFEKESTVTYGRHYHATDVIKIANGRSGLFYLLKLLKPEKVRLPFYSCDSILQPIIQLGINFEYYAIDNCMLPVLDKTDNNDFILLINYFGLQENRLIKFVRDASIKNFVIDNTHAFFCRPENYFAFNSARKFFGVTDGSFLFTKGLEFEEPLQRINFDNTYLQLRKNGDLASAYHLYKKNEDNQPCGFYKMSEETNNTLQNLDYDTIAKKRIENFAFLHAGLSGINNFKCFPYNDFIPFAYPFLPVGTLDKQKLHDRGIFFPMLWQEVLDRNYLQFGWEKKLSTDLIPLPIDHRYTTVDMQYIIENLINL